MTTQRWTGASLNRRQVDLITLAGTGDWVQGDTITLTIDNIGFIVTVGTSLTDALVATTLKQAFNGETLTDSAASATISTADGGAISIPQFSELTATVSSNVVTLTTASALTGALAGKPFTITSTQAVTGDETATRSSSITPTSQYHADQADNYSGNAVPGASDTLIFDNGNIDVRYALDLAVALTLITKYKSYTGNVGLPEVNVDNSAKPYHEYRTPTYLTCTAATTANLEQGDGPGSGRFKLNTGTGQSAINVFGKGSRIETGVPCILWKGTHASNTLSNLAGDVGVAFFGGEVATVATLVNGDGPQSSAYTFCGTGVTLTTVRIAGGQVVTNSAITTAVIYAGQLDHYTGTIGTLTSNGGTVYIHGTCTITTTGTVYGRIDLSKSAGTVTFTNLVTLDGNAEIYDPQAKATFSAGYKLASTTAKVTRPPGDTHSLS